MAADTITSPACGIQPSAGSDLLKGHSQETLKVQVSPDGKRVATTSIDETVRVWDPATGQELAGQSCVADFLAGCVLTRQSHPGFRRHQ